MKNNKYLYLLNELKEMILFFKRIVEWHFGEKFDSAILENIIYKSCNNLTSFTLTENIFPLFLRKESLILANIAFKTHDQKDLKHITKKMNCECKKPDFVLSLLMDKKVSYIGKMHFTKTILKNILKALLIEIERYVSKKERKYNATLLHIACIDSLRNIDVLKCLFSRGYKKYVNALDNQGIPPLFYNFTEPELYYCNIDHIDFLIKNGARTDIKCKRGYGILDYAASEANIIMLTDYFGRNLISLF